MYGKRRLPKPEQPPEGYVFNPAEWVYGNRRFVHIIEVENLSQRVMHQYDTDARGNPYLVQHMGISELHKFSMLPWNYDPSYNWRKKRGSRSSK